MHCCTKLCCLCQSLGLPQLDDLAVKQASQQLYKANVNLEWSAGCCCTPCPYLFQAPAVQAPSACQPPTAGLHALRAALPDAGLQPVAHQCPLTAEGAASRHHSEQPAPAFAAGAPAGAPCRAQAAADCSGAKAFKVSAQRGRLCCSCTCCRTLQGTGCSQCAPRHHISN